MKLNIGAGASKREGFLNVDLYGDADLRFDISKPWPLEDESVDEIYSHHVFEHVSYREEETLWREVYRVLKIGAKLHVEVPDFAAICALFLAGDRLFTFDSHNDMGRILAWGEPMRFIFGYQIGEGQDHRSAYTDEKLRHIMWELDFSSWDTFRIPTGNMPCLKLIAHK